MYNTHTAAEKASYLYLPLIAAFQMSMAKAMASWEKILHRSGL